jgi:DNA-binding PadR family transcriptional regulator
LALAVLVSLYEKPMHPYEIAQTLRLRAKHESVRLNYGSLYAVVEGLERRSLIVARETVRDGNRPPRTIYEITEDGSREMVDWLTDMIGVPAKEYPQFLAGLSFMPALTPEDALAAFQLRANTLEIKLAQVRATLVAAREAGLPRLFMIETEFEEQLIGTELHFVSGLIKEMTSGDLDGLDTWKTFHADGKNPPEGVVFGIAPS